MNNDDILSLPRLISSIKREIKLVGIIAASFFALALLYLIITPSKYTASTSILLDPTQAATVAEISSKAQSRFDDSSIISQIELVKSSRVAQKAMEYLSSDGKISTENDPDVKIDQDKLDEIMSGLRVYREGESYVLTITYTATDPQVAADRANAFAQAYIHDQINSFSEDSSKTAEWLTSKIEALRNQSIAANLEIQKFLEKNNLIKSNGVSVNEQQLGNMNDKLGNAKAETASKRAKYLHSKEIIDNNDINAAVAEAFDNDVINGVRTQYLEDQKKLMELRRTLGSEHEAVRNLQNKLAESRNVIFSEMKRLSQSYKSEYEVAEAQQRSLEKSLKDLVGVELSNNSQSFELEALEKEAEAYANLHDEYLKKYEVMQQQQSFPVAESRTITKAIPPAEKSHPKTFMILGLALILGTGFGVLAALIKDNFDLSFKRAGQIENKIGMHFLGFFPKVNVKNIGKSNASDFIDHEYIQSVSAPLSIQAETCRNIKVTADRKIDNSCRVIGVTTDKPHHGKSVVAANLALYIAQSKNKCLLIDADMRNPSLSEDNFTHINRGLNSVLLDGKADSAVIQDTKTGLFVLPSETDSQSLGSSLLNINNIQTLVEKIKKDFDFIIIDLPPLSATSDASLYSGIVDSFLLVMEWGKSKPNSLEFNLKLNQINKDRILGVILAQADMREMSKNYGHAIYPEYTKV